MTNSESTRMVNQNPRIRLFELVFSVLGAINCIVISILFALSQVQLSEGGFLNIWPLPAIYIIEIISLGIICVIAVAMNKDDHASNWSAVPWICSGIMFAFVIIGAWTLIFFLIPAMILFLTVGIIADRRTKGDIPLHLIYFVSAGIAQSIIVLLTFIR